MTATGAQNSEESELESLKSQVQMLQVELDETNRGVVALYAELEDQAHQLKEASELKNRFLSYLSHEFRTPLGAIRSMTRLLLDELDGPLNEEQSKQVSFIQKAAVELTDLVNDLLDLARLEAGRVAISPAWFDMVDLFAALRGMFKPMLDTDQVSLIFEEPVGVGRVFTDDRRLSQILRNFISNALKFTLEGEVRVSAVRKGDMVEFSVTDTGIGIAPEHIGSLFSDFVQIDSPIQRRFRGAGLGLAVCKKLAELLGGDVAVQSELGKGSRFQVILPYRLEAADD
jgi:signal transduction histidine kinase